MDETSRIEAREMVSFRIQSDAQHRCFTRTLRLAAQREPDARTQFVSFTTDTVSSGGAAGREIWRETEAHRKNLTAKVQTVKSKVIERM